ncbi:YXWGXW repeat-containing protein [Ameyamaea chiangmaiensis]|uniref:YXWGXW repeat-containing protein n=2 Tax=Ameyamaea chiangmaiensis TaxID=442969 RepID=A0A850PD64_9PROT|nr:YXWGXW repeat-containing protein [Ameyamaea chiangmaiensis]
MLAFALATGLGLGGGIGNVADAQGYGPGWVPPPAPPLRAEVMPPPRPGWVWRNGGWDWRGGGYVWIPGQYVRPVGPRHWGPGHWVRRGPSWTWVRPGWY